MKRLCQSTGARCLGDCPCAHHERTARLAAAARVAYLEGFLRQLAKEMARQGRVGAAGAVLAVLADELPKKKRRRRAA